jgi:hypothetical protein
MTLQEFTTRTRNYMKNVTCYAYSSKSPCENAHTYFVMDHNGECVCETSDWSDAVEYYRSESPETLVGAWVVYAVELVTLN